MAFGSDGAVYPHGDNGKQFARAVRFGMTPAQAIMSATSLTAELLGWEDKVGEIAAGKYADIIAVHGDARVPFIAGIIEDHELDLSFDPTTAAIDHTFWCLQWCCALVQFTAFGP